MQHSRPTGPVANTAVTAAAATVLHSAAAAAASTAAADSAGATQRFAEGSTLVECWLHWTAVALLKVNAPPFAAAVAADAAKNQGAPMLADRCLVTPALLLLPPGCRPEVSPTIRSPEEVAEVEEGAEGNFLEVQVVRQAAGGVEAQELLAPRQESKAVTEVVVPAAIARQRPSWSLVPSRAAEDWH